MVATKNKPRLSPTIVIDDGVLREDALRTLAQNEPGRFMETVRQAIADGNLSWQTLRNLPRLWNALADIEVETHIDMAGQRRAIMASAFPLLSGALTVAGINAAYEAVPTIGEQLVTDFEDNKRVSEFASLTSEDTGVDRVDETKDFPEVGAGEEKYEIRSKRNGRRVSITAEAIEENDLANIVQRVNQLGEIAAEFVEEQTLRRVCDIDGSAASAAEPYVLRPNGAGTSLYSTTANTPGTRAPSGTRVNSNALADESDLEAVRDVLAAMKNSRGKRIAIPMSRCKLLVPDALAPTAMRLLNSEYTPDVPNEFNPWGPRGSYRPALVSSPKLDDLSTTAWYLGWFEKQFLRKWKLRFEYVTLTDSTESFLKSRLAFQARVAWDCEIGATDYVYVVQSLSGTSAPTP